MIAIYTCTELLTSSYSVLKMSSAIIKTGAPYPRVTPPDVLCYTPPLLERKGLRGPRLTVSLSHDVDEAESYDSVYKERGSGIEPEPQEGRRSRTFYTRNTIKLLQPTSFPPNLECSVSNTLKGGGMLVDIYLFTY